MTKELGSTGERVPVVGMGTYGMGRHMAYDRSLDAEAVKALKLGFSLGMTLIDTAEAYGAGRSEEIVGEALRSSSGKVFVATKISPQHFDYNGVLRAADRSLKRLGMRCIDLYQLHWPSSSIPIRETIHAMERLQTDGKIRHIGVSNFSVRQMTEAQEALSTAQVVSNQVEYSLFSREIEQDLLDYCERAHITLIAYSPLARGRLTELPNSQPLRLLRDIASRHGKAPAQVALAWLVAKKAVIAIPKAIRVDHIRENAAVGEWILPDEDHRALSRAFAP